jgi:hypothetical protein
MLKAVSDVGPFVVFSADRPYSHHPTGRPEGVAMRYESPTIERRVKMTDPAITDAAPVSPSSPPPMPTWAPHEPDNAHVESESEK